MTDLLTPVLTANWADERAWKLTEEFFALPVEEKQGYYDKNLGGQRGYTPFKTEIAKDAKHVDLKEFWHVGRDLAPGGGEAAQVADETPGAAANQLGHVGVLLLRHDARPRGVFVGQLNEPEFRAGPEDQLLGDAN